VIAILDYDSVISALNGIVSDFPEEKIIWARNVLADSLLGIIVQKLVPKVSGGFALAVEILTRTPSAQALIKEGRFSQLESIIQTSRAEGMISMDRSLAELVQQGIVNADEAVKFAKDSKVFKAGLKR
jgi:twitching motility protein PilT